MTNENNDLPTEPIDPPKAPEHTSSHDQTAWKRAFFILIAVVVLLGAVSAGAIGNEMLNGGANSSPSLSLGSGKDGNKTVTQTESNIAAVVDKVTPSVVSVTTSIKAQSYYGTTNEQGAGTGILVSSDGYVITNNHVIDGASTVTVIDSNGDQFDNVKVIGRDPLNDIAFLKISSNKTFTPAEIGDSSTIQIGQQVVAIGNALGQYQNTVTSGIISGTGRPVTASGEDGSSESLTDLIQTDASINPGNSGGPLLNMAGQVIGINSAVADANGIGFSIPINSEKGVLAGVLQDGKIERGYIGVNYLSITPDLAHQYDLSVNTGAYVYNDQGGSAVVSGGPGDKAGLKDKDIIQKVNDQTVGQQGGLSTLMGEYKPGDTVTLTILRDGKTMTVKVTLGTYTSNS